MSGKLSIEERLKKLPRRFIVAFAARAARRVQPLATDFLKKHGRTDAKNTVSRDWNILIAEEFTIQQCRSKHVAVLAKLLAHTFANDAAAAAFDARLAEDAGLGRIGNAYFAAVAAVHAASKAVAAAADDEAHTAQTHNPDTHIHAANAYTQAANAADVSSLCLEDLARLESIAAADGYGQHSNAQLDSSEYGPLGPYWESPPSWWTPPDRTAKLSLQLIDHAQESPTLAGTLETDSEKKVSMLAARYFAGLPLWHSDDFDDHRPGSVGNLFVDDETAEESAAGDNLGLVVELDLPDGFSKAEMVELVAAISEGLDDVYQGFGGRGLSIKDVEIEEFDDAPVPVNVD